MFIIDKSVYKMGQIREQENKKKLLLETLKSIKTIYDSRNSNLHAGFLLREKK